MSKFTPLKFDGSVSYSTKEKSLKRKIPKKVKKKTLSNIIAFSKVYSVRSWNIIKNLEFILN